MCSLSAGQGVLHHPVRMKRLRLRPNLSKPVCRPLPGTSHRRGERYSEVLTFTHQQGMARSVERSGRTTGPEDGRKADAGVLEGTGAERGDAVAELVAGDHPARHRRRHRHQLLLAEADGEHPQPPGSVKMVLAAGRSPTRCPDQPRRIDDVRLAPGCHPLLAPSSTTPDDQATAASAVHHTDRMICQRRLAIHPNGRMRPGRRRRSLRIAGSRLRRIAT